MIEFLTDLYTELPYWCSDCKAWHLSLYDMDENGYIFVGDSDGNWDLSDRAFLPTEEEIKAAWQDYAQDCINLGRDDLHQFSLPAKISETWHVKLEWTYKGFAKCTGVRRADNLGDMPSEASEWIDPLNAPKEVQAFLNVRYVDGHAVLHGISKPQHIKNAECWGSTIENMRITMLFKFKVYREIERDEDTLRSYIVDQARQFLNDEANGL